MSQSFIEPEMNKAAIFYLYGTSTSTNEHPLDRLSWQKGYRCRIPRNLTIGVVGRTKNTEA